MAVAFTKFETFVDALCEGKHDLLNDTLKLALSNTAPTPSSDVGFLQGSSHPAPAAANGYTNFGNNLTVTASSQSGGVYRLFIANTSFTASGGDLGPFRYAILYNNTAPSDELIGFWDYGASITLSDGETYPANFDQTNGVLRVQFSA